VDNDRDKSFQALVQRNRKRLLDIGFRIFRNHEDAEDFVQAALFRAFRGLARFAGNAPVGAWFYRVAMNCAIDRYRAAKKRDDAARLVPLEGDHITDMRHSPERRFFSKELAGLVRKVVDGLPSLYRRVAKMRFFNGLSYREIARVLERPINTVKSLVKRTRKGLKERLDAFSGSIAVFLRGIEAT
jgi:RNA polymerase sigma-70 factor (ECF subfamily)